MPLTEEQMEVFGARLVPIFQKLEQTVIQDIARRVKAAEVWTQTAEVQAEHLRELGFSPAKIQTEVWKILRSDSDYQTYVTQSTLEYKKDLKREIRAARLELKKAVPELIKEIGEDSFQADLSLWRTAGKKLKKSSGVQKLIKVTQKRAEGELLNLTKSTGFRSASGAITSTQRAYTSVLNDAIMKTISGTFSHQEAVRDAVRTLSKSGLRKVEFQNNVTRQLDSACRNAVLTTSAQLTGDICNMNIEETGVEYVEVSKHAGARPSHAKWQGKVYRYKDFVRICKYGSRTDPDAIYSYHCRHLHFPYWPGISTPTKWQAEPEPKEYRGKTYSYYDATQNQRKLERDIRYLKRDACAQSELEGNEAFDKTAYQIKQKEAEYKRFSKAMGIRPKVDRLQVIGYDKNISRKVLKRDQTQYVNYIHSIGAQSAPKLASAYRHLEELDPKAHKILSGYEKAVKKGDISPLIGYDQYKNIAQRVENTIVGGITQDGRKIKGYKSHFIDRVIGQVADPHPGKRESVPVSDALDALHHPDSVGEVRTRKSGEKSIVYTGKRCAVTINPDTGYLIQVNPKRRGKNG